MRPCLTCLDILKPFADLELNIHKTSVLPKGVVSQQSVFDMSQSIFQTTPTLTHLSGDVTLGSFCSEGFIGIGVSIGTDVSVFDWRRDGNLNSFDFNISTGRQVSATRPLIVLCS